MIRRFGAGSVADAWRGDRMAYREGAVQVGTGPTYLARSLCLDLSQVTPAAFEASFELYRRGAR